MADTLALPPRRPAAPWPGWTGPRRPATGSWAPDKHERSGSQARVDKADRGRA